MLNNKGILRTVLLCFALGAAMAVEESNKKEFKVVCYLGSWANYRDGNGKFIIEDINPYMCTHLIYTFAKLENGEIKPYDPYLDLKENWGLGAFERFNALRKKNPKLTTLIAIGGWNEGSIKYSLMASTAAARKRFIDSCIQFLQKYSFNGLDLDWEYPANRGGKPQDKQNFVTLIKEMKDAFKPYGYLLTAAVSAGRDTIDSAYDVQAIASHLDFINLMTYDFHGGWDRTTGHHSPLYPRPEETAEKRTLNVDYAVRYWLKKGAPSEKLVLGMGLYGRTFTLKSASENGLGADVVGKGRAGQYSREDGFLGYNEICEKTKSGNGWTVVFDDVHMAPYAYKDKQWIGYDNKKSIAIKVNYIKKMNLAGGMVWSIETDDFKGFCDGTPYPLLTTIVKGLNGEFIIEDFTTDTPEGTTRKKVTDDRVSTDNDVIFSTFPTTTLWDPDAAECSREGYMRDPNDCKKFMYCQKMENGILKKYDYICGPGTVFSNKFLTCVFPYQEPDCQEQ